MQQCQRLFETAFQRYLDVGMADRNVEAIAGMLSEQFMAFGTGFDERINGKEQALAMFRRDFQSAPNRLDYTLHRTNMCLLGHKTAVIMADLDMATEIMQQQIRLNNLRLTVVLHAHDDGIKVEAHHVSFPTDVHGEEESYPLKELDDRAQVLRRMVEEETKTLQQAYREMAAVLNQDSLTGVSSCHYLESVLEAEMRRFERFGRPFSLIALDIDDFKQVNDTYGHTCGDEFLCRLGALIQAAVRQTDTVGR